MAVPIALLRRWPAIRSTPAASRPPAGETSCSSRRSSRDSRAISVSIRAEW